MYVVGLRAYDKQSNPIRNIHTFVEGPFFNLPDAQAVCEKTSRNIFNNYLMAFPKGTSFLIKEKERETTIYQLINGKQYPLITLSVLYFDVEYKEGMVDKVTKDMREEACRKLSTFIIRKGE